MHTSVGVLNHVERHENARVWALRFLLRVLLSLRETLAGPDLYPVIQALLYSAPGNPSKLQGPFACEKQHIYSWPCTLSTARIRVEGCVGQVRGSV